MHNKIPSIALRSLHSGWHSQTRQSSLMPVACLAALQSQRHLTMHSRHNSVSAGLESLLARAISTSQVLWFSISILPYTLIANQNRPEWMENSSCVFSGHTLFSVDRDRCGHSRIELYTIYRMCLLASFHWARYPYYNSNSFASRIIFASWHANWVTYLSFVESGNLHRAPALHHFRR